MSIRNVARVFEAKPTIEGAGVKLKRGFGAAEVPLLDPFLLFDDFSSSYEADYKAGFPWHPHRGIETVTYLLAGDVEHQDSLGNSGNIGAGDVQWMSAGSGIIHQEMPQPRSEGIKGFQLWVNLPQSQKMAAPRYQEISADSIPSIENGTARVRVISGTFEKESGPATHIAGQPVYLDISLEGGAAFEYPVSEGDTVLLYVLEGTLLVGSERQAVAAEHMVLTTLGDAVVVEATAGDARFILMAGTPLNEPVAWHGPIVMNTQSEIVEALTDLQAGTFIKT